MTDEERERKQMEKNAENFARGYFGHNSYTVQNAVKKAYLKIVRDKILF